MSPTIHPLRELALVKEYDLFTLLYYNDGRHSEPRKFQHLRLLAVFATERSIHIRGRTFLLECFTFFEQPVSDSVARPIEPENTGSFLDQRVYTDAHCVTDDQ